MPKIVDHEVRRAELARAVWAVIGRHGIEGATVRRVAEEAGLSMGGLRHYFDSQAGLLRFAALAVGERVGGRVTALIQHGGSAADLIETLLPVDDERRIEAEVWLAALVRSRVDETLSDLRSAAWTGTREICRLAVARTRDDPSESWAEHLHVFVDGLTLQAVTYPDRMTVEALRSAVRSELAYVAESFRHGLS